MHFLFLVLFAFFVFLSFGVVVLVVLVVFSLGFLRVLGGACRVCNSGVSG